MNALPFTFFLAVLICAGCKAAPVRIAAKKVERIVVADNRTNLVTESSHRIFHPWGMNYGNAGRLMEDFWETDFEALAGDLRELKALGANVVRIHLQVGKFMTGPETGNTNALRLLRRTLRAAEETGIYLDVTGLACYRASENPAWYDSLDEAARWRAQAKFWEIIAETCADSPAVFCYDLINEPLSPADKRKMYRSGSDFGGFDFLQYIALDPAGRKREDIPVLWIRAMTAAIRKHDKRGLITVGSLPWSRNWKFLSGFIPEKIAPELDFISVHIYPASKKLAEDVEGLKKFAVGKPVVIEETFPMDCSTQELELFLRESKPYATGWIGHYDGQTLEELNQLQESGKISVAQSIYREWQKLFLRLKPEFAPDK